VTLGLKLWLLGLILIGIGLTLLWVSTSSGTALCLAAFWLFFIGQIGYIILIARKGR